MKQPKISQSKAASKGPRKAPVKAKAGGVSRGGQKPPSTIKGSIGRRDASGKF